MEKNRRHFRFVLMAMVVLFVSAVGLFFWRGLSVIGQLKSLLLAIDYTAMVVTALMYFILIVDNTISSNLGFIRYTRIFPVLFLVFWFEIVGVYFSSVPDLVRVTVYSVTLCHIAVAVMNILFFRAILSFADISWERASVPASLYDLVVFLSMVAHLLNLKYGFLFGLDGSGKVVLGPLHFFCSGISIIGIVLVAHLVFGSVKHEIRRRYTLVFLLFPLSGCLLDLVFGSSNMYPIFCLFCLILIYVNIFSRRSLALLVANERLKEKAQKNKEQEQKILLSQIQPHFIFNTLSVIASLCRKDPEVAARTTDDFSDYLKDNLESISASPLAPFTKELDHIRKYVNIQKVRFGEDLTVEYDIGPEDFLVPSLSIQPLVENAIIHGIIRGKQEAGTVRLSTREDKDFHYILIEDDGIGFDPSSAKHDDGRVHVGLENSRERVETLTGGRIEVESTLGKGTRLTILIPRKGAAHV